MDRRAVLKQSALLIGGAISAGTLSSLLQACESVERIDWIPQFLSEAQAEVVNAFAECLLPASESPGAIDVGVGAFIDIMLKDAFNLEDQEFFISGLTLLDEKANESYQQTFLKLDTEQQNELLANFESQTDTPEKIFFNTMKGLTLLGYFTSEPVMTEYLNYAPVPGKWEGCIDVTDDARVQVDNNV